MLYQSSELLQLCILEMVPANVGWISIITIQSLALADMFLSLRIFFGDIYSFGTLISSKSGLIRPNEKNAAVMLIVEFTCILKTVNLISVFQLVKSYCNIFIIGFSDPVYSCNGLDNRIFYSFWNGFTNTFPKQL